MCSDTCLRGNTMKIQKKTFDYCGYDDYLYTGIQGFMMRQNHRLLSTGVRTSQNKKILEIGGAARPHCAVIPIKGVQDYWISDTLKPDNDKIDQGFSIHWHCPEQDPDYSYFKRSDTRFTRIIASHVWEHIHDPENALLKWVSLLEPNGIIDIAIPCDPGWAWRLGQIAGRRKATRVYDLSGSELDLLMTREHINPCQNLIRIVKAYTGKRGHYFPFKLRLTDVNLFVFFRLTQSDFRVEHSTLT